MLRRLLPALLLTSCATTAPRFSQEVAASFAQDDMRKLVTPEVELYYPAAHRDAAERSAARAAECLALLRRHDQTQRPRGRALLFLTSANFNNAYVTGQFSGEPLQSLSPLFVTDELFHWYGLPATQAGDISCHEMFHFVHYEQVENFWRLVNAVVGPVESSQGFIERWFTEGVAQYYEGRLERVVGRPHSPIYRGAFESIVALRHGELRAGDLSLLERELYPYSGAYLTSLPFIEWLAASYGEDKLWALMDLQARAFFTPLGVTLRFGAVYGETIGDLVDSWSRRLKQTLVLRERPADQAVLRPELGQLARLASHPASGTLALLTSGNEEGPRLRILERDGRLRVERTLIRLRPDREWVSAGPGSMSGLSFTADGRFLFLLNDDATERGDTRAQVWKLDAATGEVLKVWHDVGYGLGGSVRPDGSAFTFVQMAPGQTSLAELNLTTGAVSTLLAIPDRLTASSPSWSPDGARLVFSRFDPNGWNLVLRERSGAVRALTLDGAFNYGARWADATHVVFGRACEGRLQVHRLDVDSGALERLSDAPWTLVDPAPLPGRVAFINRDGTQWSLDAIPAQPRQLLRSAWPEQGASPAQREPAATELGAAPRGRGSTSLALSGAPLDSPELRPTDPELRPTAPAAPAVPPPLHLPPALEVEADEPYSSLDGLFVPQLRLPAVLVYGGASGVTTQMMASLGGRDRLAHHSWAINATLWAPTLESALSAQYLNERLAPWALSLSGARAASAHDALWSAGAAASRTFFTVPVSLELRAHVREVHPTMAGEAARLERFLGPSFSVSYSAGESTAYGGAQRLLALSFSAAAYPRGLGSSVDLLDLSAGISVAVPPPLLKRHSLVFGLSGRAMPGAPTDTLKVGGDSSAALWSSRDTDPASPTPDRLIPGTLTVAVRGYEDHPVRASGVASAAARYHYNFIIDRGFASTLYLFPSIFFRQVELAGFANATATNSADATWLRAAGASLSLRAAFGSALPASLSYQLAWRFDQHLPPLHLLNLTFD